MVGAASVTQRSCFARSGMCQTTLEVVCPAAARTGWEIRGFSLGLVWLVQRLCVGLVPLVRGCSILPGAGVRGEGAGLCLERSPPCSLLLPAPQGAFPSDAQPQKQRGMQDGLGHRSSCCSARVLQAGQGKHGSPQRDAARVQLALSQGAGMVHGAAGGGPRVGTGRSPGAGEGEGEPKAAAVCRAGRGRQTPSKGFARKRTIIPLLGPMP